MVRDMYGPKDADESRRVTLRAQTKPSPLLLLAVILASLNVVGLCTAADLHQVDPSPSSHHNRGHDCDLRSGLCTHDKSRLPGIVETEAVAPEIMDLKVRGKQMICLTSGAELKNYIPAHLLRRNKYNNNNKPTTL